MRRFLGYLGRRLIRFLEHLTSILYLCREIGYWLVVAPFKGKHWRRLEVTRMMDEVGVGSLPLVLIISVALGMIVVVLTTSQLRDLGASRYSAGLVTLALMRSLGPLFTGIVVAGRVGAAITARFGTMKVSEEVLALESMAIHPVSYLVVPVIVALAVMLPCLTLFAEAGGLFGSFVVGTVGMGVDPDLFRVQVTEHLDNFDILVGLIKSLTYALIVGVFCSYQGLTVEGGAENVGRATMVSVVFSIILVVMADAGLTVAFYL